MKARIISIVMLAWLGLLGPVQVIGPRSCLEANSPAQMISGDQAVVQHLQAFIPAQMQAAKVPGLSIALIQAGKISWFAGFGTVNTLTAEPVDSDTVFEVASISKPIAAYAALRLVELGVLSLDEPVQRYLSQPWLPVSPYAEQITLRHLLTHTSGLTNQLNPLDKTITFSPGERYLYSGVGFSYLQVVMEQATGQSLEQIAQELVFKPLQMDSSSYTNSTEILPRLAYGHISYGVFMAPLAATLVVAFTLTLLLGIIIQRIRLGKFTLSGKQLWLSYTISACLSLAFVIFILGGNVNKWVNLAALWLICFGTGMGFSLWAGWKLTTRLPGKWREPQNHVTLMVLWSFTSALVLLLLTHSLSGPVPRSPVGFPGAAYSLRSSAPDLAKFMLELASPQHLDPTLMRKMASPQVNINGYKSWGLGIGILQSSQGNALWHGGDNMDFHALMVIIPEVVDPDQINGVVLLTNGQRGGTLVDGIATYLLGIDF